MARPLTLEFDEVAVDKLHALMVRFGESDPEIMIGRALGLLETISPFMDGSTLTVVNPSSTGEEDDFIRLLFNTAPEGMTGRQAA